MPAPHALPITVSAADRLTRQGGARRPKTAHALALRARIVLATVEGEASNGEIAERRGTHRHTVAKWRRRHATRGLAGLTDEPRPGAPRTVTDGREKTQVPAREPTAPVVPTRPGQPERRTHDHIRHGTTDLVARLDVASQRGVPTLLGHQRRGGATRPRRPPGARRLGDAHDGREPGLAGAPPARPRALHAQLGLVAQSRGDVVPDPAAARAGVGRLAEYVRLGAGDPAPRRGNEHGGQAVRLDEDRRRDSGERRPILPADLRLGPPSTSLQVLWGADHL
jgi:transposase-like protein